MTDGGAMTTRSAPGHQSPTVTIGVSIGLPEPHASQVQAARRSFGDPQADAIPTHVTLLPPTPIERTRLGELEEHLRRIATDHHQFQITLRGTGSFRPVSPVVFIQLVAGQDGCAQLAAAVRTGLLHRELEFPYHPHVTIAHDIPEASLDDAADQMASFGLDFTVREFQLYVRDDNEHWRPVRSYELASSAQL